MTNPNPVLSLFYDKLKQDCIPHLERFTVGLSTVQDEIVKHDRSGVLYAVADRHFILTASHVDNNHTLRDAIRADVPLYVSNGDPDQLPFPLSVCGCPFHTTEADGHACRDVAAIELDDEVVEYIEPNKAFLRNDRIGCEDDGNGAYLIVGYPAEWMTGSSASVAGQPLFFTTRAYCGRLNPETKFDARIHIALEMELKACELPTRRPLTLPDLHGVSGCGIWRIADPTHSALVGWSPRQVRLVALQHSWGKTEGYVLGTWIKYAAGLIVDQVPDLRRPMNLAYRPTDRF